MPDDIAKVHQKILTQLMTLKEKDPELRFSLRRSNVGYKISQGNVFYGDEKFIAISFWSGMDWAKRAPNISFYLDLRTWNCMLYISASDSLGKKTLLRELIVKKLQLKEARTSGWFLNLLPERNYLVTLRKFVREVKPEIDDIIRRNEKIFQRTGERTNRIYFFDEKVFVKNLTKVEKLMTNKKENQIPQGIGRLSVRNFGPIKSLRLDRIPENTQWIFFTGQNGTGKTTILKAISTAITNGNIQVASRYNTNEDYELNITIYRQQGKLTRKIVKKKVSSSKILTKGFVAFGPVRLDIHDRNASASPSGVNPTIQDAQRLLDRPYLPLFNTRYHLLNLATIYASSNSEVNLLKDDADRLQLIRETLVQVVPGIADIHFSRYMRFFEVDENKELLSRNGTPFHQLASGLKSLIALVSHTMIVLFYQQPSIKDPSQLQGIVIIDEIDIHFHPVMQKQLVELLSKLFPRVQFIATTHSPIPLLGAPPDSIIFKVKRNAAKHVHVERISDDVNFSELLPNALLTSPIFGLKDIFPAYADKIGEVRAENTFDDVALNKQIEKNIDRFFTPARFRKLTKELKAE